MTPSTSLPVAGSPDSQSASHSDRPERSRNAKAQARHRAKRKAYIDQLEQTVTKLQTVLALSPDQVAALPPPLVRIRELEQENDTLHREIEELRRQLEQRNAQLRPDLGRRSPEEDRRPDRDLKRRRLTEANPNYMSSSLLHSHSPPPPLMIPSPSNYTQTASQPHSAYPRPQSSSLVPSYGFSYQIPTTPSGSSSTSSPSFSQPSDYAPSNPSHRHPSSTHAMLPPFSHATSQYDLVKLEEDNYHQPQPHHTLAHNNGYSGTVPSFGSSHQAMDHWHSYSAERT